MYRPVVMGQNGLVAAAHPLAALAGLDVLKEGGNAFDAAIAVNAVMTVVHPHKCGIGGDVFFLMYIGKEERVVFLNGSGRSPCEASIEILGTYGYESMPSRGVLTVTVPGCVDGWGEILTRFGSMPLKRLLKPAVYYAREGFPLSHQIARSFAESREVIQQDVYLRECFTHQGKTAAAGEIVKQEGLAKTLELIGREGTEVFYRGDIARRIHKYMTRHNGLLTQRDLELHSSTWAEPIGVSYGKYIIWQTPPNTQGMAALVAFNILEGHEFAPHGFTAPEYIHFLVEAKKLAYEHRNQYITDPEFVPLNHEDILDKQYAQRLREMICAGQVREDQRSRDTCLNTTGFVVADRIGNVVSGIQSLSSLFGSGCVVDETGIILQNRGSAFSLNPSDLNRLEPHKRTFHTLTAGLVTLDNRPVLALAASGGDGQPQTHLQIITKLLNYGLNIQEAIEEPRWLHGAIYAGDKVNYLNMEGRFPIEVVARLEGWGHNVRMLDDWALEVGQAQGLVIDQHNGVFYGGADPRIDGYVAAW